LNFAAQGRAMLEKLNLSPPQPGNIFHWLEKFSAMQFHLQSFPAATLKCERRVKVFNTFVEIRVEIDHS
jgi:hypothetical protein